MEQNDALKDKDSKRKKKKHILAKIIGGITVLIVIAVIVIVCYVIHLLTLPKIDIDGTPPTYDIVNTTSESEEETPEDPNLPTITLPSTSEGEDPTKETAELKNVDGVYNIILLGADKPSGYLTDAMIVATINQNDKSIKLTSFMRDILVEIPDRYADRLNTVYASGGKNLLYQVFRESFGIELYGYVLVDYDSLAKVVDALGGVELYVSAPVAEFLNTSNYIENPEYRNLIPGAKQMLNGGQVVGYCRQRYVGNGHESNDFARTQRQREVLITIYNKFRTRNLKELTDILTEILPMVTTDMTYDKMLSIATKTISAGLGDIEQMRIPVAGTYAPYNYIKPGKKSVKQVIQIDFDANVKKLHEFIFGE